LIAERQTANVTDSGSIRYLGGMLSPTLRSLGTTDMNDTQTPSRLITWCGRLALLFLILVPLAVLCVKYGLLSYKVGLPVFALSCVGALVVLLILAIVSFLPRFRNQRKQALINSLFALPPVLLFGALMGPAGDFPPIHDITTNTDDPPVFVQGVIERGSDSNSLAIKPDVIAIQLESFPDLGTIVTELSAADARARTVSVAESLGWEVYNNDPNAGIVEASYTSFWFGFVDDIVIRIRQTETGTELDLRSISRVGQGDLGANAKRISAFISRF
jgi:uncharacterized protein (DUF1499 family)